MDLGTGDGQAVLRTAQQHPERLVIGIDADSNALAAASQGALRKPQRGGAANALFVHAAAENLPHELAGIAESVTVFFPWGSLLRAVVRPDVAVLRQVRSLCRPDAGFEAAVSIDADRDGTEAARLGLVDGGTLNADRLASGYLAAGFRLRSVEPLSREEVAALPSTWAKRLAHGRPRPVWRLRVSATAGDDSPGTAPSQADPAAAASCAPASSR